MDAAVVFLQAGNGKPCSPFFCQFTALNSLTRYYLTLILSLRILVKDLAAKPIKVFQAHCR
jgi:hypothetical protein